MSPSYSPGLDDGAVAALIARARRDVDEGLLPSCQIALGYAGEVVASETFGAPAATRYVTFSVSKAFNAGSAWLLLGDGALRPETRVADLVDGFAANGKSAVTVEHLLTHTAGFARAPMRPEEGADHNARDARMATWRLDWEPGSRTEYHATSAYWALASVIEAASGQDHREHFATCVAGPLGVSGLSLGAPVGEQSDIARLQVVGVAVAGQGLGEHVAETAESLLLRFNTPEICAAGVPGAGAVGSAADIAIYYQSLLTPARSGVWNAEVVIDATKRVRNVLIDPMLGASANRTLGLVVAGEDGKAAVRGFGAHTSARAFGAMGIGGQVGFADPETGLSFGYLTNGLDVDVMAARTRSAKIAGLAARCVRT